MSLVALTPSIDLLCSHLRELISTKEGNLIRPRITIAVSGTPGSGKTTLARDVAARLNTIANEGTDPVSKHCKTVVVPMDGFHLPRAQLDAEALRRRGAPHTFDAAGVVRLVEQLKMSTYRQMPDITAPSFDHALKDPVADDIVIPRATNIVILEGNYLLLRDEPWDQIGDLVDETWLLQCDMQLVRTRLAHRHVEAGIVETLKAGFERADFNDLPNGQYLLTHSRAPTVSITQALI